MSDVDRLLEAADVQDENAKWMDVSDSDTYYEKQRYEAEAALLRAVADERGNIEWISRTMSDGHPSLCVSDTWKVALALADTILGVADE